MTLPPSLLDSDTMSEILKGKNSTIMARAALYLRQHAHFTISLITRYEILRGLKVRDAMARMARFEWECQRGRIIVLPLTDAIIVRAAEIYADLYQRSQLISDADILIAATAIEHNLVLVTNNLTHFQRIQNLQVIS
ncbi:MAG: type II toxin-antitoxin system VapC family toxin [Armatimonadota bacterium]